MKKYTCTGCKSVFYEGNVPAKCPICGCPAGFFKETTASAVEMIQNSEEEVKTTPAEPPTHESTDNVNSYIQKSDVVTIIGYTEHFAVEKAVEVYKNGLLIGSIPPNGKMDVQVDGRCELIFKCGGSNTVTCEVKAGDWIVLSLKNQLKALLANQSNYVDIVNRLQQEADNSKRKRGCIFDSVLCIVLLVAFGFFSYRYVSHRLQPSNTTSQTQSSYSSDSYSQSSSYNSNSENNQYHDDSSTKWKEFAGTTYKASQFTSEGYQYYAFSYDRTGKGKYIIWWNYLGTDVVEDKMEFSIYNVESEGNNLYLYSHELNSPVKIEIQGSSLYTMNGDRYEIW